MLDFYSIGSLNFPHLRGESRPDGFGFTVYIYIYIFTYHIITELN
jgi:hypothetical protein